MIQGNVPTPQPSRIVDCGQPWHGLAVAGSLDYGGADPMDWTQPDSGDCWAVRVPGAPGSAQGAPSDPEHQWLDYGLLSGWWSRQLYGQALPAGRLSYVYSAGLGDTYIVDLSGLALTNGGTDFGGDVLLHSTVVSGSPPDTLTIEADAIALGAAYSIWDVVAFNEDGSAAILGLWPASESGGSLTYSSGAQCRGIAYTQISSVPYRVVPHALAQLDLTDDSAELSILKTPGQTSTWDYDRDYTYNGAAVHWFKDDACGFADVCPVGASCADQVTGDYVPDSSDQTETWSGEIILGEYFKPDGSLAYVTLELSGSGASSGTGYGISTSCEGTATAGQTSSEGADFTVSLKVDGATKSEFSSAYEATGDEVREVFGSALISNDITRATIMIIDGEELCEDSTHVASYAETRGHRSSFKVGSVIIQGIRYSNHAYGLMVTNLGVIGHANDAYLGGVVNVLDGTRGTALGFLDAPDDTIEYPYTERFASVQPDTETISVGTDARCYV